MRTSTVVAALLIPVCLFGNPNALRYRTAGRRRREEFEFIRGAWAGDVVPARESPEVTVRIHWQRDWRETAETCNALGVAKWGSAATARNRPACNRVTLYTDGRVVCDVYVPRPVDLDDEATLKLGHETAHCFLGDYHE